MRADYHFILWQADHNNQYKINLKELSHEGPITVPKVTLTDPMKRGLKGSKAGIKGRRCSVTLTDPMKRGLKEPVSLCFFHYRSSYTH